MNIEQDTLNQIQDAQARLDKAKRDLEFHKLQLKQIKAAKRLGKTRAASLVRTRFLLSHAISEEATGFGYCFTIHGYKGALVDPFFTFTGMEGAASRYCVPSQPGLVVYLQP